LRGQVWAKKLPYVGIVHNTGTTTMRSIERMAPELTIANSDYTASRIPEAARRSGMGLHVIHPPMMMNEIRSIARRKYVTLVNVSAAKGADVFFDLALNNPHVEFLGVHGGHGVQEMSELDNVTIMPSTHDMSTVYAQTQVLVFPSMIETYGKVVGEAMAYGIPVIASDLPGVREAGGDAPIYCEPDDKSAWQSALTSVEDVVEFRHRSKLSMDRAEFLYERSEADLDRFESLLMEIVRRHR